MLLSSEVISILSKIVSRDRNIISICIISIYLEMRSICMLHDHLDIKNCMSISRCIVYASRDYAYLVHILLIYYKTMFASRDAYIVYALQYTKIVSILRCIHDAYRERALCMHLEILYFSLKMHVLFIHIEMQT